MSVISKGITLSYKAASGSTFTELNNLMEIPELGGSKDSIEVTTLADSAHVYTDGIDSYGDSITFKFLYDATQFAALQALNGVVTWKVSLPDGANGAVDTTCTFSGTAAVKLDGVGVNAALTYQLSIRPISAMVWG